MRNAFAAFLQSKIERGEGERVVVVTGDLGYSVLEPLQRALGPRFVNAGVAEASMTTMAASWAADGFKVFTYSITPFATFRCLEQIRNDVCYHDLDVTIVGVGAGYGYGVLGPTHHALEDLAALWSLPNLAVFCPADVPESKICFDQAWNSKGPKYLRLGKGGEGALSSRSHPPLTVAPVIEYKDGDDLTVVTTGNILSEVLLAVESLRARGSRIQVLSCPWLKPFPAQSLLAEISSPRVAIVEELSPYGGFSGQCSSTLVTSTTHKWRRVKILSAPDQFASLVGASAFQREQAGLSSPAITKFLDSFFDDTERGEI
jgi:transketolase